MTIPHDKLRRLARRLWFQSSEKRKDLLKKSRVQKGFYQCEQCLGLFEKLDIEIDHVTPVGPVPGSRNATEVTRWEVFYDRLFNGELQALCKACHRKKTESDRRGGYAQSA